MITAQDRNGIRSVFLRVEIHVRQRALLSVNRLESCLGSNLYVVDGDAIDLDVRSEEDSSALRIDGRAHLKVRYGNASQLLYLRSRRSFHKGLAR